MTSKAGHTFTAGPWSYEVHELSEGYSAIVYDERGHAIADHLTEDRARLIAAAPELLAALQWALAELDKSTSYAHPGQFLACDTRARAAIAKATAGGAV